MEALLCFCCVQCSKQLYTHCGAKGMADVTGKHHMVRPCWYPSLISTSEIELTRPEGNFMDIILRPCSSGLPLDDFVTGQMFCNIFFCLNGLVLKKKDLMKFNSFHEKCTIVNI